MHSLVETDAEPLPVEASPHPSDRVIVASLIKSDPPGWLTRPTEPGCSLTIKPRPLKREVLVHSWEGACTPDFVAHVSALGAHIETDASDAGKSSEPRVSRQRNVLIWNYVAVDGEVHRLRCLADTGCVGIHGATDDGARGVAFCASQCTSQRIPDYQRGAEESSPRRG